MNEYLRQLLEQFRTAWQKFSPLQKFLVVALPTLVLAGLVALMVWSSRPRYRALYSNMNAKDAASVVEKLRENGVEYQLTDGGSTVSVPSDRLYETRLTMASAGLPLGGGVGFEVFDKTSFGVTDFTQKVNYQRALEGELTRTISGLEEIRSARVHLVSPEDSLYKLDDKEATASVVVDVDPRASLRADQIRGVVFLVASSVEGLNAKNVTLLDQNGNVLSELISDEFEPETAGMAGASRSKLLKQTDQQMDIERKFERTVETRVSAMLDRVLGPNRSTVKANAELSFDQMEQEKEIYEPVVNNQGIVRSRQTELDSMNGVGTLPGGIPGTESNIPGYQTGSFPVAGTSAYTRSKETVNMEINKTVERSVQAPGTVRRLSVAVMVDNLQPQQIASIRNSVISAAGLDLARGDTVSVENISFDTSYRRAQERALLQEKKQALWTTILKGIFILLLVIFLLLFLRAILKPRVVRVQERLIREITRVAEDEAGMEDEAAIPLDMAGRPTEDALEAQRRAQIREHVINLAKEKPQAIAMLVKRWLSEE